MPTILTIDGVRFFFYSKEESRIHVHVSYGEFYGKVWMDNFEVVDTNMSLILQNRIKKLARKYEKNITQKWKDYFKV